MDQYGMIREILEKSAYTVAMCGTDMMKESGMQSMRAPEISYKVEREYGYSPEEIFSSVFYTNRTETFLATAFAAIPNPENRNTKSILDLKSVFEELGLV